MEVVWKLWQWNQKLKSGTLCLKKKRLVDNLLDTLYEKSIITWHVKIKATPDGPSPAHLQGWQKIHKPLLYGLPKHKHISSKIGSSTCKMTKFLLDCISPISKNEYTLKDYIAFVSIINKKHLNSFMSGLVIDILFTNNPLEETIDIVIQNMSVKT